MATIGPKEAQRRELREDRSDARIARARLAEIKANPAKLVADVTPATKRGRPPLALSPEEKAQRRKEQSRRRVAKHRAKEAV
jgi:hypothetical protein